MNQEGLTSETGRSKAKDPTPPSEDIQESTGMYLSEQVMTIIATKLAFVEAENLSN